MKKVLFCILTLFVCVGVFAQRQPVVAVAPFDAISGISATDANMITRVFNIRLGNTNRVTLVDRSIIDRVLQQHHFQLTDWSDMNKTAELGRALNADWIVRGELEQFGRNILLTVQFFDINTFRYMGGGDIRIANLDDAYDMMEPLVNNLVQAVATITPPPVPQNVRAGTPSNDNVTIFWNNAGSGISYRVYWNTQNDPARANTFDNLTTDTSFTITGMASETNYFFWVSSVRGGQESAKSSVVSVRTPRRTYNIGDIGPGGGTVFSVDNGRYKEFLTVPITTTHLNRTAQWQDAMSLARNFVNNGFSDWRPPTRAELELMYRNVGRIESGLSVSSIWSSTENGTRAFAMHSITGAGEFARKRDHLSIVVAVREFY